GLLPRNPGSQVAASARLFSLFFLRSGKFRSDGIPETKEKLMAESAKVTTTMTEHETAAVMRANASGLIPVMFVHGLWLLPSSWDRWADVFEAAGYVALTPGWPDDPATVTEARAHPGVF